MDLSPAQITFLRRLVNLQVGTVGTSQAAEFFYQDQRLGSPRGRQFNFTAEDWARARRILDAHGIPIEEPRIRRRADATLRAGVSEKDGSLAPHGDSIPVKVAAGDCRLGNTPLQAQGYMVMTADQVCAINADRLLIVENLENFRWLERNAWIDYQGLNVLALYRGDNRFKLNEVRDVIEARKEPVWAFFDFDPAGLGMASQLPRLERLVLPPESALRNLSRKADQAHLYAQQVDQWRQHLDACKNPDIQSAWAELQRLRVGLAQELMRD